MLTQTEAAATEIGGTGAVRSAVLAAVPSRPLACCSEFDRALDEVSTMAAGRVFATGAMKKHGRNMLAVSPSIFGHGTTPTTLLFFVKNSSLDSKPMPQPIVSPAVKVTSANRRVTKAPARVPNPVGVSGGGGGGGASDERPTADGADKSRGGGISAER